MHYISHPSILYFGTPVVVVSTVNEDGTYNLAPISSIFWLGYRCMIGIAASSKTTENLLRTKECVLNLPSVEQATQVNRLALTTGTYPVPPGKLIKGYVYEPDKFGRAGFTPLAADCVQAMRIEECPVHLEATLVSVHPLTGEKINVLTMELEIQRVHLQEDIRYEDMPDRVDPDKWRPLIMSFQELYGLGVKVHSSTLAQVPEHLYQR
ncbi:flavin reductase family protein [[Flexibacter] sp. ATCC 35208]|uniref:flavin reductase family protein n=1 Tax=[Flexibacter] sp. ATCC 35208 TaxID=1936242 RepID=UPI0009D21AA8|nr:flavin reductase family protein [[Flexibacter] sp. ATCC 35208]OMP79173.1 flavin reductase [[Flexibacter] sp. ATCC 35208]